MSLESKIKSLISKELEVVTRQGNRFNQPRQLVKLEADGKLPILDGSLLTGVGLATSFVEFTATEDIAQYDIVTATGKIADSSNLTHRDKVIGISNAAVLNGFVGSVTAYGKITNAGWSWIVGSIIYLNSGSYSTVPPSTGFIQQIGVATASDTIDVDIKPSIRL